jgi:hypothetical protein
MVVKSIVGRLNRLLNNGRPSPEKTRSLRIEIHNTVICHLSGGLANQMICYKMGRFLAHSRGMALIIDATNYEDDQTCGNRNLQLTFHEISCSAIVYSRELLDCITSQCRLLTFAGDKYKEFANTEVQQEIRQALQSGSVDNIYVDIWTSFALRSDCDQYFRDLNLNNELRFDLDAALDPASQQFRQLIMRSMNSVAVHVRRGDYATHCGGMLVSKEAYLKAIQELETCLQEPSFFVFSDDIAWCRQNLSSRHPMHFSDFNDERSGYKDMALGALCDHYILSNESTYSHLMLELAKPNRNRRVIRCRFSESK